MFTQALFMVQLKDGSIKLLNVFDLLISAWAIELSMEFEYSLFIFRIDKFIKKNPK